MSGRFVPATVRDPDGLWGEAERLLAYGDQHRVLLRSPYPGEDGVFPRFAVAADGYEVTDETGRRFVDWSSAWGPAILGYRHPRVEEAIQAQLEAGPSLPMLHPVELDVARALTEMVPCAEMVAFGKNGSDAVTAAVRIARAATGRDMIIQCGSHGFHDWYTCMYDNIAGTPAMLRELVVPFPYGDLRAVEALLGGFADRIAAVVMDPVDRQMPTEGFLEGVRRLAHAHGALLVFDEVVTAFRLAPGGAQEAFGVEPDLACLGAAMANGMPLSAVVGKREYMRHLPHVAYGMTFRGETLSLAAARATLEVIRDEAVPAHLAWVGGRIRDAFDRLSAERELLCGTTGPDARLSFGFETQGDVAADRLHTLFLQECAANGVLTNGTLLPSFAHDDIAIALTVDALAAALDVVAELVHGESGPGRVAHANGDRTLVARGFIDGLVENADGLVVAGWLLVDDVVVDRVELVSPEGAMVRAERVEREGVAEAYPAVERATESGFETVLPHEDFHKDGIWEFELRGLLEEAVVFRCSVARRARPDGSGPALQPPYAVAGGLLYI